MAKKIPFLIVLLFSVFSGLALLHKGLFPTHDGEYHVIRFYEFDKVFRSGQIYPRWQPDLNYGYGSPLLNYYYPLPNYFAAFFHFFGASFIDAFQYELFTSILIGSIFMYLWVKSFWGNTAGVVSAIFYTYSPYHFVDVYVRGSVGEALAMAFLPGVLWALTKAVNQKKTEFAVLSGFFTALIIFSHNILALMFFIFITAYMVFLILANKDKTNSLKSLIVTFSLGLSLSSIFWLPALFERQYARGLEIFDYSRHFPDLYQLLVPSWGTGFSGTGLASEMSFQIGLANLIAVFLAILVLFKEQQRYLQKTVIFFIVVFGIIFFLMLKESLFVWKLVPLFNYFQFPWRFLSLETLAASFLAGSIFGSSFFKTRKKGLIIIAAILVLLSFLLGAGYMKPAYYFGRGDDYYLSRANFMDGTNTPGNAFNTKWFNAKAVRKSSKIELLEGNSKVVFQLLNPVEYEFRIQSETNSKYRANIAYFPGWTVVVDGKKKITGPDKEGLFGFEVPKGEHMIEIKFENTLTRQIASAISLASFLLALALLKGGFFVKIKR